MLGSAGRRRGGESGGQQRQRKRHTARTLHGRHTIIHGTARILHERYSCYTLHEHCTGARQALHNARHCTGGSLATECTCTILRGQHTISTAEAAKEATCTLFHSIAQTLRGRYTIRCTMDATARTLHANATLRTLHRYNSERAAQKMYCMLLRRYKLLLHNIGALHRGYIW